MLTIEGALAFEGPEGAVYVVWQEFGPAKFRRSLRLGTSVDGSKVEALSHNGLLMLTMPQSRELQAPPDPGAGDHQRGQSRLANRPMRRLSYGLHPECSNAYPKATATLRLPRSYLSKRTPPIE